MRVCMFNFNNEVDQFEIHVEDDGKVTVPGGDGQVLAEYDSVQQLAEIYAMARDVKPDNLKNWTLLENGDVYSFVLRAGTAGVDVADVEEQVIAALDSLTNDFHPLNIARAREQILGDGTADLVFALVHCTEAEIANAVYDRMSAVINGTDTAEAEASIEEDTRSGLEKFVDKKAEEPGALVLLAVITGIDPASTKEEVLAALQGNFALSNVDSLRAVYDNAVGSALNEGIGVGTIADALTVLTQTVAGVKDDSIKNRLVVTARMAGRNKVNVSVDIVGRSHIRHTAEMVSINELEGMDLYVRDNVPYIVRFNNAVDAELEAERDASREDRDADGALHDGDYDEDTDEVLHDGYYDDEEYDDEEYDDGEE